MGSRLFFWIGAIVLAGLFIWGMDYVLTPENGDAEFQKMLDATEQVKSFRGTYVGSTPSTQHAERLWEVDCNRSIVHKRSTELQMGANPVEMTEDIFLVRSDQKYTRNSDGSWEQTKYTSVQYSASWYCDNLAQGTLRDLLPNIRAMLRSATFGKGDKKTVNGVRCQDWKFSMHSATSGQRGSVCIGLEDHLPYEMTTDDVGHYSYTDYNQPLQFDAPEAVLQAASSSDGSN
ncbi:hypothetical protein SBA1_90070 [Candidatus Sulfotelmatobacter kueseliae]|uniref:Uncharacterized protein n=1 Tax=Candidatus Sulfotelmatobacter kueseliae TaxID=2042962 RepID=A0A2U3LAG3_9BACT|nr:hypothetical protein SBA1_90070 [Candidatus Sulfotelmatobacter kueseliae]